MVEASALCFARTVLRDKLYFSKLNVVHSSRRKFNRKRIFINIGKGRKDAIYRVSYTCE